MSAEEPSSHFRESRVDATTDQSLEDQAHLEAGSLTSPHDFLWNMGEQFNTASSDSAQDVLQAGVTSLGMSSGAMHAGIWSFESDTSDLTPMHRWRGGDRPFGVTEYLLPALRPGPWMQAVMDADVGKVSQFEASEVLREPGQHDGLILSIGVVSVDGPRSIFITIFHSREVNASVGPIYTMLRGFMILTRQVSAPPRSRGPNCRNGRKTGPTSRPHNTEHTQINECDLRQPSKLSLKPSWPIPPIYLMCRSSLT